MKNHYHFNNLSHFENDIIPLMLNNIINNKIINLKCFLQNPVKILINAKYSKPNFTNNNIKNLTNQFSRILSCVDVYPKVL